MHNITERAANTGGAALGKKKKKNKTWGPCRHHCKGSGALWMLSYLRFTTHEYLVVCCKEIAKPEPENIVGNGEWRASEINQRLCYHRGESGGPDKQGHSDTTDMRPRREQMRDLRTVA